MILILRKDRVGIIKDNLQEVEAIINGHRRHLRKLEDEEIASKLELALTEYGRGVLWYDKGR